MIIDRNASVTPNRYETPWLRRSIGKRLGRASRDDVLSAFVWVAEVRLAEGVAEDWREFCAQVAREREEAETRRDRLRWRFHGDQVADLCRTYASKVVEELHDEHFHAEQSLSQCNEMAREISHRLGLGPGDGNAAYGDTQLALGILHGQLEAARRRVDAVMGKYRRKVHLLAEVEERQRRGTASPSLTELDAMTSDQFDEVIRGAFERSGFQTKACGSRLTEISRDDETQLVYSAHVQNPKSRETNDVRSMIRAQCAAEASGRDAVLVLTNLEYISHPANLHIEETTPDVRLVQRAELQRWIHWEMPLQIEGAQ
ncbi:hypothetical protein ACIBCC_36860 [Streptomyces griseus]|uniref:hypothetical protein n=1 Tax=Streptomyces griseus TaxID=1911 RepID=UPI0037ABBA30